MARGLDSALFLGSQSFTSSDSIYNLARRITPIHCFDIVINIYHIYLANIQDFTGKSQRQRDCRPSTHNILVPITIDFTVAWYQDVVLLLI